MSRTPAAELARLKVAFPDWTIRRLGPAQGGGFRASRKLGGRRTQSLRGTTLADLEYQLRLLMERRDTPGQA